MTSSRSNGRLRERPGRVERDPADDHWMEQAVEPERGPLQELTGWLDAILADRVARLQTQG